MHIIKVFSNKNTQKWGALAPEQPHTSSSNSPAQSAYIRHIRHSLVDPADGTRTQEAPRRAVRGRPCGMSLVRDAQGTAPRVVGFEGTLAGCA
jgi:hypothetical protein